jgi:hypothetical protein
VARDRRADALELAVLNNVYGLRTVDGALSSARALLSTVGP